MIVTFRKKSSIMIHIIENWRTVLWELFQDLKTLCLLISMRY